MQYPILLTVRPGELPAIHIGAGSASDLLGIIADLQHHGLGHLVQAPAAGPQQAQPSQQQSGQSVQPRPLRQRVEPQPMPEEPPACPDHGGEMGWSQWDYWYCPVRAESGEWCRWRWDAQGLRQPAAKRAAGGRRGA